MSASRGWTYQEGLLSKRRLIFTDDQVVFVRNGMRCIESAVFPLDAVHDQRRRFRSKLPLGVAQSLTPDTAAYEVMRYISEFAKRDLTFLTDRLHAIRGIFHVFEKGPWFVHQLMGVLILPSCINSSQPRSDHFAKHLQFTKSFRELQNKAF
jgi:hypothetical protein